jgi:hypothetical protein
MVFDIEVTEVHVRHALRALEAEARALVAEHRWRERRAPREGPG